MQIRELYIDGFGKFHNITVKNFHCGINILYGSNEFGKTTILEFIRRILFGFPKRKSIEINPYLPQKGGTHGGHLVCELANGENFRVHRTYGPNGGRVTVTGNQSTAQGQELLNALLGHASSDLFHNIFAFSLDELQELGSLQGEEVKSRIYSAGLGLGPTTLTEAEKHFQKTCEDNFKTRGKNQKLNLLFEEISGFHQSIQNIQKELSSYDQLQVQAHKLETDKGTLNQRIRDLDSHRHHLENLADLYPVYIEWEHANEELKSFKTSVNLPTNAVETLKFMKTEIQSLSRRIEEENEAHQKLQVEIEHININENIIGFQNDVITLRNMTEQIRLTLKDLTIVSEKRERLDFEIEADMLRIGKEWKEEAIINFQWSSLEINYIQSQRELIDQCRQKLSIAKERLEEHQEEQARLQSQIFRPPEWLRVVAYSLIGLGSLGMLGGGIVPNLSVLILSTIILVLGGVSLRMIFKSRFALLRPDLVSPTLQKRISDLKQEQDQLFQYWRTWLDKKGLDIYFSPIQTEKTITIIKEIQNQIARKTELDQRLEKMQMAIEKAKAIIQVIQPQNKIINDQLPEKIESLCTAFEESARNQEKQITLKAQLQILSTKIHRLKEQVKENQKVMNEFIESSGADSLVTFEDQCQKFERAQTLKALCREKQNFIQSRTGLGDFFNKFIQTLRNTNPDQIQQDLETANRSLNELYMERDTLNQQTGKLKAHIDQLSSDKKLSQFRLDMEIKKTCFNRKAREWAIAKIASSMLERTKRKHERERQPEVLRAAQNYFSMIIKNPYCKIYFSLDSEEIQIENIDNGFKIPSQMSRGTREQLYLALRLGLIENYETRSEPLPIIMDDVLVNFDDDRGLKAIESLKNFAEKRQVIIFSCHQKALEIYQRLGANTITLNNTN